MQRKYILCANPLNPNPTVDINDPTILIQRFPYVLDKTLVIGPTNIIYLQDYMLNLTIEKFSVK